MKNLVVLVAKEVVYFIPVVLRLKNLEERGEEMF
jgi:hypothetical protein